MKVSEKIRVLIAEDDYLVSETIKHALNEIGYELVGKATDGLEVIEMACAIRPDVVLMDIQMPELDGLQASGEIQKRCPMPIVILTAHDSKEFIERASEVGVSAYLLKPPKPSEIQRAIRIALARHGDLIELRRAYEEIKFKNKELENDQKKIETDLRNQKQELIEKRISQEKTNEVLKAILDQREIEKKAIEQSIVVNLKKFVFPYLDDLEQQKINKNAAAYLNIIRANIEQLIPPASKSLSSAYIELTPTEIKVADFIRQGKSTKSIAAILNVSTSTVEKHRNKIRQKFNILKKKVNLHTYLNSLS